MVSTRYYLLVNFYLNSCFLTHSTLKKWACLTYFILKQAVLTHGVYKPQILLRMTSRLFKVSVGAQPWMEEACITGSMFLLNGNKKCDWHALIVSA
jgi:hypothetical protein